ncbi:MAG: 2-oxoglutarate dehydrogenase E1 component [Pseudomonadota bacterium]
MNGDQTHLFNAPFVDALYETYLVNPEEVSADWREYFAKIQAEEAAQDVPHAPIRARYERTNGNRNRRPVAVAAAAEPSNTENVHKQNAVLRLINYYRVRGHQAADLDPLNLYEKELIPDLTLDFHNLSEEDLNTTFDTGSLFTFESATLAEIHRTLQQIYCRNIGAEYMHITDTKQKRWVQERMETLGTKPDYGLDTAKRQEILERLTAAEGLEHYLHTQYTGQKRFSLEGGESLIPCLDEALQRAGASEVKEAIIGMAHRGRLNVLVNIMGKSPSDLFEEFEGKADDPEGSGDVKYHQGYSSDVVTPGGTVHLSLAFNPSHLEIINPVVEGSVRARQERRGDKAHNEILPILIHGDAAFSGQGVVMETLNLAETHGYKTGGTLHIIVNNQIGFTTSEPFDSRSTLYCTDVAKMVQAPIFHVNGDNPEAVIFVTQLALDYRMTFNKDVVIDIVCYRRHGHNETDEPMATQPIMYERIRKMPTTWTLYAEKLIQEEILLPEDAEALEQQYRAGLKAREHVSPRQFTKSEYAIDWTPFLDTVWTESVDTSVPMETLIRLGERLTDYPEGFGLNRSVKRIMDARTKMTAGEQRIDWGFAEALAYASLLEEGTAVRLSGQDCGRGTFAHRHAVLHEQSDGSTYLPLQHLSEEQAKFLVINSLLSEEAVLGFEFGFTSSDPHTLVLWEAQFGDFVNGAQVVIDQFISSSEAKWQRFSSLVMLLPHGYDGQGPEHSSARLERFLQLCAEDNIQVCVPSTPAQLFHMLRRQIHRPYRKPLIIMMPKSLLRDKRSSSTLEDLSEQQFEVVIDDHEISPEKVRRVVMCCGQVYFKLLDERRERGIDDIALVRVEQLYPYPRGALEGIMERYSTTEEWCWAQDEPRNQGAWRFMRSMLPDEIHVMYVGRPGSASPAVGHMKLHQEQLAALVNEALG